MRLGWFSFALVAASSALAMGCAPGMEEEADGRADALEQGEGPAPGAASPAASRAEFVVASLEVAHYSRGPVQYRTVLAPCLRWEQRGQTLLATSPCAIYEAVPGRYAPSSRTVTAGTRLRWVTEGLASIKLGDQTATLMPLVPVD